MVWQIKYVKPTSKSFFIKLFLLVQPDFNQLVLDVQK